MQHLMILREQITPFDINFVVVQKELDLSHMRESFTSLFRGKFSWRQSSPRVVENHSDSKKVNILLHSYRAGRGTDGEE